MSQGEYRDALRQADLALGFAPGLPEARAIRARALLKTDRGPEAIEEAEALLADNPDDWIGHAIIVAAARGSFGGVFYAGDVESHAEAVERLAPEKPEAYSIRAALEDSANASLQLYDKALDLDPGYADALEGHALSNSKLKNSLASSYRLSNRAAASRSLGSWA